MQSGSSNRRLGRRKGGSRGNKNNGNTNNNKNKNKHKGWGSNGNTNTYNSRNGKKNAQRLNQSSMDETPSNATTNTASPSNTSNNPITTVTKTMSISYAAAASRSSTDENHQLAQSPQNQPKQRPKDATQQIRPSEPKNTKPEDSAILDTSASENLQLAQSAQNQIEQTEKETTEQNHPSKPNNTKLEDSAILASNFVPDALKEILYANVSKSYQARRLPDMLEHCNRTYFELVPHASQLPMPPMTTFPTQERTIVPLDPYFALRPATKHRRLKPKPIPSPVDTESSQPPPKQQHFTRTIPSLENAKGRDDYLHTFRLLLQEEFEEKMILYERYTQYQASVKANGNGRATIFIPGISNARPALQAGDEVLLRKPALQAEDEVLPWKQRKKRMKQRKERNADKLCEQVHAEVVRVIRGTWKNGKMSEDRVIITWLDGGFERLFDKFVACVRFLPSSIHLQRTLEALQWMERMHPIVAQQLLFPTETPKLPMLGDSPEDMQDLMLAHAPTEVDTSNTAAIAGENGSGITTSAPTTGPKLNEKQTRFVHMVLKRTRHPSRELVRPPMILTGPAGTGKTKTLLTSIIRTLQQGSFNGNSTSETRTTASNNGANGSHSMGHSRLPKKHILVCAPSHTACDVITRRLSKSLSPQQLFRLYPSSRSIEMVPAELLPFVRMQQHEMTEFILPPTPELLSFEVIVCTCSDAHILTMAGLTNSRLRLRRQHLQNYALGILQMGNMQISGKIVGTLEPHFTHLFIDEAAQATEPESLIPLSVVVDDFPDAVKVEIALAGDPRQLSPDVYSPLAAGDLQKSLLERLLRLPEVGGRAHMMGPPTGESWTSMDELIEYSFQKKEDHDHLSVFLTTNYRGHASFLIMPSKLFYFDKLRSANPFSDSVDSKWCKALRKLEAASSNVNPNAAKQDSWPIHFRGVLGTDQSTAVDCFLGSNSWSNPVEATEIVGIVENIVSEGISTASIGIMGAFRGQVILIRRLLREKGLGAVNVGIVEDYQAVERDVIIVSLTRSNSAFLSADMEQRVGLFQQTKRMNVALTRAENLLVVVGDPAMMEQDQVWKEWLAFCYHHGFWYGIKGAKSSIS